MEWLYLSTPPFRGWRLYFGARFLGHFTVGFTLSVAPFSGENSDVSLLVLLPWLEIDLGVDNDPY